MQALPLSNCSPLRVDSLGRGTIDLLIFGRYPEGVGVAESINALRYTGVSSEVFGSIDGAF